MTNRCHHSFIMFQFTSKVTKLEVVQQGFQKFREGEIFLIPYSRISIRRISKGSKGTSGNKLTNLSHDDYEYCVYLSSDYALMEVVEELT